MKTFKGRLRRRGWLILFLSLCLVWCFWHPLNREALFRVLPETCWVTSYHQNLADEWDGLMKNERFRASLRALEIEGLEENVCAPLTGQILNWVAGKETVFGIPTPCDALLSEKPTIVGATTLGWKTPIFEALRLIRWVPGLGRLRVSRHGARYTRIESLEDEGHEIHYYLSLEIQDGLLLAVLSLDEDAAAALKWKLIERDFNQPLAMAFGTSTPWEEVEQSCNTPANVFWARSPKICEGEPIQAGIQSLQGSTSIRTWLRGPMPPALASQISTRPLPHHLKAREGEIPKHGVPFAMLFTTEASSADSSARSSVPPIAKGWGFFYVTGAPFEGRLLGLSMPALHLWLPAQKQFDYAAWYATAQTQWKQAIPDLRLKLKTLETTERGMTQLFFPSQLEFLGSVKADDMAYWKVEADQGQMRLGTHWGSYQRHRSYRPKTPLDDTDFLMFRMRYLIPQEEKKAFCVGYLKTEPLAREIRHLAAILKMGSAFMGGAIGRDVLEGAQWTECISRGLVPLDVIDFACSSPTPSQLQVDIEFGGYVGL